jgi:hypothetical protein
VDRGQGCADGGRRWSRLRWRIGGGRTGWRRRTGGRAPDPRGGGGGGLGGGHTGRRRTLGARWGGFDSQLGSGLRAREVGWAWERSEGRHEPSAGRARVQTLDRDDGVLGSRSKVACGGGGAAGAKQMQRRSGRRRRADLRERRKNTDEILVLVSFFLVVEKLNQENWNSGSENFQS